MYNKELYPYSLLELNPEENQEKVARSLDETNFSFESVFSISNIEVLNIPLRHYYSPYGAYNS